MLGDYLGEVHWGFKDNAAQPCPRDGAQMRWANKEEVDEIDELVCGGDNRQAVSIPQSGFCLFKRSLAPAQFAPPGAYHHCQANDCAPLLTSFPIPAECLAPP